MAQSIIEVRDLTKTFGDKTVEYRSVDELKAAIDLVKRDLFEQAAATGLWPGAPRQIRVTTGKGF